MKTGMTNAFSTHDLGESYPDLHAMLIEHGKEHDSRLGKMREITDMNVILHDPTKCLPQRKGYSKAFALAEIDQFVAGVHDGGILQAVSPQAASMITKDTNYGVRVGKQMVAIESELRANRMSRRAVAYVGHPDDLVTLQNNPQQRNDRAGEIACSCVWNFMIREDKLHMLVYTRSWDVVWGLCYDISSASAVQMMLATALGVEIGYQSHHATSLHVYEMHYELETERVSRTLQLPWLVDTIVGSQSAALERMKMARGNSFIGTPLQITGDVTNNHVKQWYRDDAEAAMI